MEVGRNPSLQQIFVNEAFVPTPCGYIIAFLKFLTLMRMTKDEKGLAFFQKLIALKCLKCQKIQKNI
jgi:hypothetical protein